MVHDKMMMSQFLSYLSQMWMDFASIWVLSKVIISSKRTEKPKKPEVQELGFRAQKKALWLEARPGPWKP